ncbi:MAG: GNAT family N-acetyltransferase [Hoeflea sp.]|uniref:GNAT family N-acetyltransferase n=1 Tax=Hoeflea sp. TaxID=1940281 RepID=UPI001D6922FE|nr:GNAT family N-acetyltransferase [Hoeflea sp.]MBU4527940.1 GNAT family N-acetyltransferase [Alphaproteobacteria bacterium]MBU4546025.1 GNAT family N-acetyltransferase [Alphaproteobacteria bacterium]MBU4553290.1 GNAT family N-acetyltransferase [Alphaproteobacteria bacterium]MBV1724364.1 GNAT family N-acetyltransferase [Hoeflea sp.]MBV1763360.1 GNAT family N-acetyltransferase [Hoeflea sp.]
MRLDTTLTTRRLRIRTWEDSEADRAFFHRVNSDEAMLKFYPFRRNRSEADDLFDLMRARNHETGFGWAVAEDRDTAAPLGFTGLAKIRDEEVMGTGVEIGWRYVPEAWGKGLATEAARALLAHGFDEMGLDRIVAFAVTTNTPSLAVMRRIGMTAQPDRDFDHPGVPDTMPHLKRHAFYQMQAGDPRL